jgi:hypothetical protein
MNRSDPDKTDLQQSVFFFAFSAPLLLMREFYFRFTFDYKIHPVIGAQLFELAFGASSRYYYRII